MHFMHVNHASYVCLPSTLICTEHVIVALIESHTIRTNIHWHLGLGFNRMIVLESLEFFLPSHQGRIDDSGPLGNVNFRAHLSFFFTPWLFVTCVSNRRGDPRIWMPPAKEVLLSKCRSFLSTFLWRFSMTI